MNPNRANTSFLHPHTNPKQHPQQNNTKHQTKTTKNHQSQRIHQHFVFQQRTAFRKCPTVDINGAITQGLSSLPTGKLLPIRCQQSRQLLLTARTIQRPP
ncbi:hypothetical protein ACTHS6_11065, partial [Neisseria sp. P0016.S006]